MSFRFFLWQLVLCISFLCTGVSHSLVVSFHEFVHESSGQRIFVFGDYHADVWDCERTVSQRNDMLVFIAGLPGEILVIIEDLTTASADDRYKRNLALDIDAQRFDFEKILLKLVEDTSKKGKKFCDATPLSFFALSCEKMGVKVINCELLNANADREAQRYISLIREYNDQPILNEFYAKSLLEVRDEHASDLLESYVIHELYNARDNDAIVVFLGYAHCIVVTSYLEKIGYKCVRQHEPKESLDAYLDRMSTEPLKELYREAERRFPDKPSMYERLHAWLFGDPPIFEVFKKQMKLVNKRVAWLSPYAYELGKEYGGSFAQENALDIGSLLSNEREAR